MKRAVIIKMVWGPFLGIVFVAIAVSVAWKRWTEWPFRSELPPTASEIHESFWEDRLLPDYSYHLKAKITAEEFREYCRKFALTPHSPDRVYEEPSDIYLVWSQSLPGTDDPWWNPSKSLDGTFVAQAGDTWTFAKYEGGYLFVKSLDH